jgi:hypothetical protein
MGKQKSPATRKPRKKPSSAPAAAAKRKAAGILSAPIETAGTLEPSAERGLGPMARLIPGYFAYPREDGAVAYYSPGCSAPAFVDHRTRVEVLDIGNMKQALLLAADHKWTPVIAHGDKAFETAAKEAAAELGIEVRCGSEYQQQQREAPAAVSGRGAEIEL